MSTVTSDTNNNLLKYNGPFRVLSTNDGEENIYKINDIYNYQTQGYGENISINTIQKVGETIKFENCII